MHIVEKTLRDNEKDLGKADVSPCLPGWIDTLAAAYELGQGYHLSKDAVSSLLHTLIAGRVRAERLVLERNKLMEPDRRNIMVVSDPDNGLLQPQVRVPETHVGPDGNTYATCRCSKCGVICHGMSGAYLEHQMCPSCAPKD